VGVKPLAQPWMGVVTDKDMTAVMVARGLDDFIDQILVMIQQ
jgi:hypothetical protein